MILGIGALHNSALKNHADITELLLSRNATVNLLSAAGFTPLHEAALGGATRAAQVLLKHGAQVDARDKENGATPLYIAASWGHADLVAVLVERGASVNAKDHRGISPLQAALRNGHAEIAAYLRRKGAS